VPASAQSLAPAGVQFRELEPSRGVKDLNRVDLEVAWNENNTNPAVRRLLALLESPAEEESPV
jgi:hypothetical protein